jgi:hypothetical protein
MFFFVPMRGNSAEYNFFQIQRLRRRFFFAGFLPGDWRAADFALEIASRVFLGSLAKTTSYDSRSNRASSAAGKASLVSRATH